MIHRTAFFADFTDIPEEYRAEPDDKIYFEPEYNIPTGGNLRLIIAGSKPSEYKLMTAQWGEKGDHPDSTAVLNRSDFWETVKNQHSKPCVVLLSGFYVWKKNRDKEHPFFVRMLNKAIMPVAGVLLGDKPYASMILTDSNPLVHPMSEKMPLVMNRKMMNEWLNKKEKQDAFIQQYNDPFLLTDFSVLRVSKKVNDLKNDDESLIQPIPK